jgi:hypothetical protein
MAKEPPATHEGSLLLVVRNSDELSRDDGCCCWRGSGRRMVWVWRDERGVHGLGATLPKRGGDVV